MRADLTLPRADPIFCQWLLEPFLSYIQLNKRWFNPLHLKFLINFDNVSDRMWNWQSRADLVQLLVSSKIILLCASKNALTDFSLPRADPIFGKWGLETYLYRIKMNEEWLTASHWMFLMHFHSTSDVIWDSQFLHIVCIFVVTNQTMKLS